MPVEGLQKRLSIRNVHTHTHTHVHTYTYTHTHTHREKKLATIPQFADLIKNKEMEEGGEEGEEEEEKGKREGERLTQRPPHSSVVSIHSNIS